MTKRTKLVRDLKWAKLRLDKPPMELSGHTAAQRAGHVYEEKCANYLRARFGEDRILHNPWIEFCDRHGRRWAQPDIVLLPPEEEDKKYNWLSPPVVILECKLTYTRRAAESQLRNLYYPLVQKIWGFAKQDHKLVQVCKNLTNKTDRSKLVHDLVEVIDRENRRMYEIWSWRPTK